MCRPPVTHSWIRLSCALLALLIIAGDPASAFAATGDPLPGVDILIKRKPSGATRASFGTPDLPAIPADFFGPGSDPFIGQVALDPDSDGDGIDETSSLNYLEGATPNVLDARLAPLTLVSEVPIRVTSASGVDSFFDVTYEISADGLPPGEPVRGIVEIPPGGVFSPGSSNFVVDSFFDIEYRISFTEEGTGNPAGSAIIGTVRLDMTTLDPSIYRELTGEVVLGSDGSSIVPIEYASGGGGHVLTIQSVPEPGSLVLLGVAGVLLFARGRNWGRESH